MATKTHVRIDAQPRAITGKKVSALRRQGILPAHIFGHGDPVNVQIDAGNFRRLRETHQTTGIIDLILDGGQPETVLVRHMEHAPRTGQVQHVDFFRVRMNEAIHARVPLLLTGDSPAARQTSGVVLPLVESVEIECMPDNLPDAVALDVSKLVALDIVLHASDIDLPNGVKLLISADEPVAKVQPPRAAPEEAPPATIIEETPPLETEI